MLPKFCYAMLISHGFRFLWNNKEAVCKSL
jgi:hypothetical protein